MCWWWRWGMDSSASGREKERNEVFTQWWNVLFGLLSMMMIFSCDVFAGVIVLVIRVHTWKEIIISGSGEDQSASAASKVYFLSCSFSESVINCLRQVLNPHYDHRQQDDSPSDAPESSNTIRIAIIPWIELEDCWREPDKQQNQMMPGRKWEKKVLNGGTKMRITIQTE